MFPIGDQNDHSGVAFVTIGLVVLNVLVWLLEISQPTEAALQSFVEAWGVVPREYSTGTDLAPAIPAPYWITLLTSMFMHGGWGHLGGNMLFLWIFGDNVEHRIGHVLYLVFYLAVGVVASVAQILTNTDSIIPTLGASGAISGVLGAYLVMFPTNRVTVFLFRFLMPVPAIVAIGIWAVFQFISGLGVAAATSETGGVAYMAHIGGFVAGVVAGFFFRAIFNEPRRPRGAPASAYG